MTQRQAPVVAVDGPSGVGKGTLCALLAARSGFHLLDSGALYRLVGLAAQRAGVATDDEQAVTAVATRMQIDFVPGEGEEPVSAILDGEPVGDAIRSEACGRLASEVAALAQVRAALLDRQRAFRRPPGLIADGRDMGTVVFPDAEVKIFLDASAEARTRRRYKQLMAKGISASLDTLFGEIVERDERDRNRAVAPLRPAPDAVVVDTTELGIADVLDRALEIITERGIALGRG